MAKKLDPAFILHTLDEMKQDVNESDLCFQNRMFRTAFFCMKGGLTWSHPEIYELMVTLERAIK